MDIISGAFILFLKNNLGGVDVLITYGWVRSTYAALVNLSEHGLSVGAGDSGRVGMCQWSRYPKAYLKYPNPAKDPEAFVRSLADFIRKYNVRVLIPSHDESEVVARHADAFPSFCTLPIPSVQLLAQANDKSRTQQLAESLGIPTATRIVFGSIEELGKATSSRSDTPLVIRLRKSNSAKGVFYPSSKADCLATVARLIEEYQLTEDRFPVVQEYVAGEGWGVSCLYWKGERIAHFTHRRLREKTQSGGTSTLREHKPNPILEEMAFKLLDALQWHGLAMVEFKYDQKTKQGWFIEINPRLWGSIHLAVSAGVEFPYLLYLAATQGPVAARDYQSTCTIKYPWISRWYLGDCIIAAEKLYKGEICAAFQLLKPGNTDSYDDFNLDDPMAFAGEVLHYGTGFLKGRSLNPVEEGMIG